MTRFGEDGSELTAGYHIRNGGKRQEKVFEETDIAKNHRTRGPPPLVRILYCIIYSTLQAWARVIGALGESFPSLPERIPWATMVWT